MSKDSPLTRNKCMDTSKLTTSFGIPVKGTQAVLKAHLRAHPAPAELYLFLRGAPQFCTVMLPSMQWPKKTKQRKIFGWQTDRWLHRNASKVFLIFAHYPPSAWAAR